MKTPEQYLALGLSHLLEEAAKDFKRQGFDAGEVYLTVAAPGRSVQRSKVTITKKKKLPYIEADFEVLK